MKVNIENASAIRDPAMKPWLLDELVRNLKEMRDRSNAGDMAAAVAEFFEIFRFNDNQMDLSPIRASVQPPELAAVAYSEKAMELATDLAVESLRLGSYEARNSINAGFYKWQILMLREKREAAREKLRQHLFTTPATQAKQDAVDAALAYLDDLKDDAAAHIFPSDLVKCNTSECVVEVVSVRAGNKDETTVPLFSRDQVADAIRAAISAKKA